MIKFSIVTSYYNRRPQFYRTLKSIEKSIRSDEVEVIVTDDCSSPEHKINDLVDKFKFPIKVIEVKPEDRWYTNPCVPFNMAIREAQGEIIILQNPECMHLGDVLDCIGKNMRDDIYLSNGCYSIDAETTRKLDDLNLELALPEFRLEILNRISPIINRGMVQGGNSWYNHSIYRAKAYHFIGAMAKSNMDKLGGFDERYAMGIAFDDDELIERIHRLGLKVLFKDSPMVIHQWHYVENNFFAKAINPSEALFKNKKIFDEITKKEMTIKVNTI